MGKLHHLVAKLAENLDKLLEGADSLQMVQGDQDLKEETRSESVSDGRIWQVVCVVLTLSHYDILILLLLWDVSRNCKNMRKDSTPF